MALQHHNALSLLSISIILMIQPFIAHGSNRGSIGLTSKNASSQVAPPVQGICATSVRLHGYKCLEYDVETQDGYILSVQRIPEGISGGGGRRQPVLIQHGVLVDGSTWFLNPAEQNLPFILADQGFDVWIANTRGTRYSRRHRTLDPKQPAFWNWSWDELVTYDLPAAFEFVYTQTGQKIDYVGHSMGTLIALASFSEGRQVDKLKSAALLSPIAYLSHMTTPIGVLAAKSFVGEITTLFGLAEFNPKGEAVGNFIRALCAYPGIDCYDLLTSFTGKNCCLNASTVELFLKFEPQSTSTKNMVHMAQTVRHGVVAKFNYGNKDLNLEHYGEVVPPLYNISNIPHDLPIFLSYGGKDALSDVRDVDLLLDGLKYHDGNKLTVQFIQNYAHADFIMGINAKDIAFWNWSWDELVTYDLPAAFEFVYKQTGQKIDYVGHSMGTLIALASFSEGRQVDKLKSAALLSPIAYLSHMTTPIGVLAAKSFVGEITTLFGLAEFNPKGEAVGNFIRALCAYPGIDCYDLLTSFTGKNCCLNASTVELFLKFEPQSTSTKNMVHMAQTVRHGVVAKFNYGNKDLNLEHYGEVVPPLYNISNIPHDLPIFLSYGGKDALSDVRDVDLLLDGLKYHDGNKLTVQFIQNYAHADFIMGINAKDIVYKAMIAFFKRQ